MLNLSRPRKPQALKTAHKTASSMGLYQQVAELWKQPKEKLGDIWKQRLIQWRQDPVTLRIDHPTRIDRARSLGYKAKLGIFMVRQRVSRGTHIRPDISGGRKSKNMRIRKDLRKNYQVIAEERAGSAYPNCEVLNSYFVGKDGMHFWYEVILVDRDHPAILADHRYAWMNQTRGRASRGLTSAGKKMRGLRYKGRGVEKARPSRRANDRRL
jgi:large subunit ribosomal protein L15e